MYWTYVGPLKLCLAFYYKSRSYNERVHFFIQISIRHPCCEKTVRKRNEFQNKKWLIIRFLIMNVMFYVKCVNSLSHFIEKIVVVLQRKQATILKKVFENFIPDHGCLVQCKIRQLAQYRNNRR